MAQHFAAIGGAAPGAVTFEQWVTGDVRLHGRPPTAEDLGLHLTTLFPPVRLRGFNELGAVDGDPVPAEHIAMAVTAGGFVYGDGATQTFEPDGATTYVEHGQRSAGEWYVDGDGRFCSFWPPSYRACYDLRWLVEDGVVVGLTFTELHGGSVFAGRYR